MYKQHVRDKASLEKQVEDVMSDVTNALRLLEEKMKEMKVEDRHIIQKPLEGFKAANEKLNEIVKTVLKDNKNLQKIIQVQTEKIKMLEESIVKQSADMKQMRAEQAEKDKNFQRQLDEINRRLDDPSQSVETHMSSIVTAVMAAKRFMQPLSKDKVKAKDADKEKSKPNQKTK